MSEADLIAPPPPPLPPVGHNSAHSDNGRRLLSMLERIERLKEEQKALSTDIRDIFLEAKSVGFDVATMRILIKLRGVESAKLAEQEALLDTYRHAIGL